MGENKLSAHGSLHNILARKKRSPVVNGIFYPDNPEVITSIFASWDLDKSDFVSGGKAIIAPHGAWDLTGSITAKAFSAIQGKEKEAGKKSRRTGVVKTQDSISRVLLLGTHHHSREEGIFLSESASFETPLGEILVDQSMNQELASCSTMIEVNDIPHLSEHSLEVMLPFVKYCLPKTKIIPILMSGNRAVLISCLAKALRITLEKSMNESLIIISSSVSQAEDPALALSMADEFVSLLGKADKKSFLKGLASGVISACAGALIGALLESGLLGGSYFSSLCPLVKSSGENRNTVYNGAFASTEKTSSKKAASLDDTRKPV